MKKVILNKAIDNLGAKYDVVMVKDGYARNYLFPKNYAVKWNISLENSLSKARNTDHQKKENALAYANKLKEIFSEHILEIEQAATKKGNLYGAISAKNVTDFLKEKHSVALDPKVLDLKDHIKKVGNYIIEVHLYEGVNAEIKLSVKPKEKD
jgi:large subunit ribosomal protein L9